MWYSQRVSEREKGVRRQSYADVEHTERIE